MIGRNLINPNFKLESHFSACILSKYDHKPIYMLQLTMLANKTHSHAMCKPYRMEL